MAGHVKTRRRSRIEIDLPAEIRKQVDRLLLEPSTTYDEIKTFLTSQGYDISRSSIGRYGKEFFEAYQQVKRFEDQSRALVGEVGDGMTMEEALSKVLLQKVLAAVTKGDFDVMEKSRLLADFAKLQSSNIQREKLKDEYARAARIAAEKVEVIAKKGGLSAATVQQIRKEILGIAS